MASEQVIHINAGGQRYDVHVSCGLLRRAGESIRPLTSATRIGVVTNYAVHHPYSRPLGESLAAAGFKYLNCVVAATERHKLLSSVGQICDYFLAEHWERAEPIIAFGGGVIGDMAGFAAASLLRGVPLIHLPTSLLSMVDASVGGKTGVNTAAGKNLIGAFHQPRAVLIDPEVLSTLPPRELRNGLAEVIKHYVIRDAEGFARLEARIADALRPDIGFLTEVIARNVAIKASVVEADPFEQNVRAHLNFGHTFGHAFEHASNYALSHGEAVALGMCAAMHVAVELGMVDAATRDRVIALIAAAELPTRDSAVDVDEAIAAMRVDKKASSGKLRFVLAERIGAVSIRDDVPADVVRSAVRAVCE